MVIFMIIMVIYIFGRKIRIIEYCEENIRKEEIKF